MAWSWITSDLPPDPDPEQLPAAEPDVAHPVVTDGDLRVTWVGHATHLIQLPGLNLVTDPMWSERASPVPFLGTRRFVPPLPALEELPPVHAVLLSHDHFDHLDRRTVVRLRSRFEALDPVWYVPLGYRDWFARFGVERVVEMDWWEERLLPGERYRVVSTPARHWTRRTPWGTNRRLWSSWAIVPREDGGTAAGQGSPAGVGTPDGEDTSDGGGTRAVGRDLAGQGIRVYFGGDSAYASVFREIGERLGPFDASILPIGAYDPRWFMKVSHMNPEEAVQVYRDLGGTGAFLPSHWGTFRLTFEDPLEPPRRLRAEWERSGLDPRRLHVPRHGETVTIRGAS